MIEIRRHGAGDKILNHLILGKTGYASQFLYILALCLAKFATLSFVLTLTVQRYRPVVYGTMGFAALWYM